MKRIVYLLIFTVLMVSGVVFTVSCGTSYQSTAPAATSPPTGNAVTIENFAFSPATLTVSIGTTVTWTNKDSATHTIVSSQANLINSGNIPQGGTFSFTFKNTGSYDYHCGIHPSMTGKVIVE